ncbi:hypothetical protein QYF61_004101 [Mycteria americana]|uniref:Reverse transcriptase domain-containing protein n=1 Tax=Mycteria americana TaxID=33587 RepID=A0AAN7NVU7_MYCAM|nr:hypothetical protein QYF61_004101 [Mycteria americana]
MEETTVEQPVETTMLEQISTLQPIKDPMPEQMKPFTGTFCPTFRYWLELRLSSPFQRSHYLDRLPQVYEMTTSLTLQGTDNSPCTTGVESEKGEEPLPSMTVAQLPPVPSMPILATRDHSANGTPVVKVPNKKFIMSLLWELDRKNGTPTPWAVLVDLAKAFSTVSHSHTIMALKQKGIDDHFIALIKNIYDNITTQVDLKNEQSDPIRIQTGVKQDDLVLLSESCNGIQIITEILSLL